MNEICIYHHLGLGDHITCNAIVRSYSLFYEKLYLFVKRHNMKNVEYLYRDMDNIELIPVIHDVDVRMYLLSKPGIKTLHITNNDIEPFDKEFYKVAGMPFELKWEKFYVERDIKSEQRLYDSLDINEPYALVHTNGGIDIEVKDIRVIRPDNMDYTIFEYMKVIENAKEIHVANSSFLCLVDSMDLNNDLYFYAGLRKGPAQYTLNPKLNWKICTGKK